MQLIVSKIHPGVAYDYLNGKLYRLKVHKTTGKVVHDRLLLPSDEGFIQFRCYLLHKSVKKRAITLIWEILHEKQIDEGIAYFKDNDSTNLKANNIGFVSKSDYALIRDAVQNTNGGIRIERHPSEAFSYVVKYKRKGREASRLCHDIVFAMKMKRKLLHRSMKVLSKYVITT